MIDFLQTQLVPVGFSNALIASAFAFVVFLLTQKMKLPLWTHALWVLVLVKLVAPPLVWLYAFVPDMTDGKQHASTVQPVRIESAEANESIQAVSIQAVSIKRVAGAEEGAASVPANATSPVLIPWMKLIACGWLFGSVIVFVRFCLSWHRFRRWVQQGQAAPETVQDQLAKIGRKAGVARTPEVRVIPGVMAPSIYAFAGRATLLLPAGLLDQLNDTEMETIIAHELIHVRRRDHWVRLLEVFASVLFWWHPVVAYARKKIHQSADEVCDMMVKNLMPNSMRAYASAMLKTVDFLSMDQPTTRPKEHSLLLTGMGDVQSLSRRMLQIRHSAPPVGRSWPRRTAIGGFAILMLPVGVIAFAPIADGQEPASEQTPDKPVPQLFGADPFGGNPFSEPKQPANMTQAGPTKLRPALDNAQAAEPRGVVAPNGIGIKADVASRMRIEEGLRKKLKQDVSINAVDLPLAAAIKQLSEQANVPILIDLRSLEEFGLTPDLPVNLNLQNVSLLSTLRLMCRNFDLSFMIKNEVIQITTPMVSEMNLTVRAYSLPSVLATRSDKVLKALTSSVQPDTWEQLGGPSSANMIDSVLVVSSTESVHAKVEDFIFKVDAAFERRKKLEAMQK